MKHLDLFSGIGGFALACEWAGIETIGFVEIDKFCQKVLKKHWSDVPIVEDVNNVKEIKAITDTYRSGSRTSSSELVSNWSEIDKRSNKQSQPQSCGHLILTAGFPCQPFSNAGRKRGSADDRYLWPQPFAVIEATQPDWIVLENVPGILNMVFPDSEIGVAKQASLFQNDDEEICYCDTISGQIESDIRQAGYETAWLVIPACAVNAPHRRDRVWIVAHAKGTGNGQNDRGLRQGIRGTDRGQVATIANATGIRQEQPPEIGELAGTRFTINNVWSENWYEVATRFCRVDDGVSNRVHRLKALGNAIVPQVAYQIIKAIKEVESIPLELGI